MRDPSGAAELPLSLDRGAEASLPTQLATALRGAIDAGILRPGELVQATRQLALRLGVARGVVVAAYEQLIAEGYLEAGHGRGTFVRPELPALRSAVSSEAVERRELRGAAEAASRELDHFGLSHSAPSPLPLTPGVPDTGAVDRPAWRSAWRHALIRAHVEAPDLGDPRLRVEIAEHLRRMRGTNRLPEDVIVTAGAREGLGLLLTALGASSNRRLVVGVEDPGYPSLRRVAIRHGAQILALPVDAEGLDPHALPTGALDVIIVTPSHQYPLGGSLPLARRRELLTWAARAGVVIVEDDYDSELRHTGSPLPALAALDDPAEGSVVLLGTFSTTISHALSAGYLLAPARLRKVIEPVRHDLGGAASAVVQAALAEYLAGGELRRHTARMRRRYATRRDLVVSKLDGIDGVRVRPMSGGLHAVLEFDHAQEDADAEERILKRTAEAGLGAVALSRYWQRDSKQQGHFGLVIGTGGTNSSTMTDHSTFEDALTRLRGILSSEFT